MSEETKMEGIPAANAKTDTNAGNQPETISLIDKADSVAKRMEEANKKSEELLARHEAILARQLLGGRAIAGEPMKTKEQIAIEEVDEKVKRTLAAYGR